MRCCIGVARSVVFLTALQRHTVHHHSCNVRLVSFQPKCATHMLIGFLHIGNVLGHFPFSSLIHNACACACLSTCVRVCRFVCECFCACLVRLCSALDNKSALLKNQATCSVSLSEKNEQKHCPELQQTQMKLGRLGGFWLW